MDEQPADGGKDRRHAGSGRARASPWRCSPASHFNLSPSSVMSGFSIHLAVDGAGANPVRVWRVAELREHRRGNERPGAQPRRAPTSGGVLAVVVLYLSLNLAYLWVLTPAQVAASPALAADVARAAAGGAGARFVALLIVVSSLGFLAVVILTGPRLYYAMAADGLLSDRAARLHPRYHTPAFALWFQAGVSLVLLTTNTYDELLSYVVFADWLFFGLTAGGLFIGTAQRGERGRRRAIARVPGHPWTTLAFVDRGGRCRRQHVSDLPDAIRDWFGGARRRRDWFCCRSQGKAVGRVRGAGL